MFQDNHTLSLPIPQSSRQQAQQFCDLFEDLSIRQQVYLDTLAILVVNNYVEMMGIETDLLNSESWNPILRLGANLSDLKLTEFGHLECRGVTPGVASCSIPQDVWENRIGYVIVEIEEDQTQAKLLGFIEKVTTTEVLLEQLRPLDALLYHLSQLRQSKLSAKLIRLHQWFEEIFEKDWQPLVGELGLGEVLQPSFRNYNLSSKEVIRGVKFIDLGIELQEQSVFLVVLITPEEKEQIGALVQLHPMTGQTYLPHNIQLSLLEQTGQCLKQVCAGLSDNYIQLPYFQGQLGERFQIQIAINQTCITELFCF